MKKLTILLVCLFGFVLLAKPVIKAEEEPTSEVEVTPEVEEEPTEEITEDDIINSIKDKLGTLADNTIVLEIISWLRDAGVITALLGVVVKYNKYKNKTLGEIKEDLSEKAKTLVIEKLNEYSKEIGTLKDTVNKLNDANETLMKVLVLMQDNTASGKLAVLDYLTGKEKEVKEVATAVKEQIEEKKEETNKIVEQLDYTSIF